MVRESQEIVELALKELRRDRALAFYGAEDLTPVGFYYEPEARRARAAAKRVIELVTPPMSVT